MTGGDATPGVVLPAAVRRHIRVAVFDLGGVLLQLRDPIQIFGLAMSRPQFLERWLVSPAVREFERGATDAETFARAAVSELGLSMPWEEFLRRFDSWPERFYPEAAAVLDAVPDGVRRVLLSNTNAAHWARREIATVLDGRIDQAFLSFRTGLLKPDEAAFRQVITAYDLPPQAFLFFDDHPLNVAAANSVGMNAFLCDGPANILQVINQI